MTRKRLNVLAAAIVALGGLTLATTAHADSGACWLSLTQIINISDAVCGESATSFSVSDISCTDTEASWTVTCNYT